MSYQRIFVEGENIKLEISTAKYKKEEVAKYLDVQHWLHSKEVILSIDVRKTTYHLVFTEQHFLKMLPELLGSITDIDTEKWRANILGMMALYTKEQR